MRIARRVETIRTHLAAAIVAGFAIASPAAAQAPSLENVLSGVVHIKTFIHPDARTMQNLGREREGSGVVIDANGLVLTIGYLMVEAYAAEIVANDGHAVPANIVGYDHESGFGLLQTETPLKVRPVPLGKSAELRDGDPVVIAAYGGPAAAAPAKVVARRTFAGSWEYLIDDAIFTAPPYPAWSGAALLSREGKLVGIGSLIVGDTSGTGKGERGNMFVPIDALPPILGDLIASGRTQGPAHPWLGLTTEDVRGKLTVARVTADGPAEKAGFRRGDIILGVAGEATATLAELYRKVWAVGEAGSVIPLDVLRDNNKQRIDVKSMNRLDHLKLKSTL